MAFRWRGKRLREIANLAGRKQRREEGVSELDISTALTGLLAKIKPAVKISQDFSGEKTSRNEAFVRLVAQNNVKLTIEKIRQKSPIFREMEQKGEIKIVGAFYTLTKGELIFLN